MQWDSDGQRKRFWLRSEWIVWIRSLPTGGFGRHTKTEWQDWFELEDAARREAREEDRIRGENNLWKLRAGPLRRGMPGYVGDIGSSNRDDNQPFLQQLPDTGASDPIEPRPKSWWKVATQCQRCERNDAEELCDRCGLLVCTEQCWAGDHIEQCWDCIPQEVDRLADAAQSNPQEQ